MRKWFLSLLALCASAAYVVSPGPVWAQADLGEIVAPTESFLRSRAAKLRTNAASDPDTVWIGHVRGATGLPGLAGGYGPYKVGRGLNRVKGSGTIAELSGFWDFDNFQGGETDSLQGWWPLNRGIGTTGGVTLNDKNRAFHGMDHGNLGNYVINQGSPKRTFGVIGYWHRDRGNLDAPLPDSAGGGVVPGPNPEWAPLAGTASAWCGLRAHGDLSAQDPITLNYFNQTIIERRSSTFPAQLGGALNTTGWTDMNFPGYGDQWDQLMYRDIQLTDGSSLTVSFTYRTNMDNRAFTASAATRIGWFHFDPLKGPTLNDGNFISSTDASLNAPVDSFSVLIGTPVNDASCTYSDGVVRPVYDPLRRWLSEIIKIDGPRRHLLSKAGENAATSVSVTVPNAGTNNIQAILNADGNSTDGGRVRIVFRVKTNRGFSDADYAPQAAGNFTSKTAGAAIVDNVVLNGWAASNGDFEAVNAVDNSTGVAATLAWKTTGKPPGIYFHPHNVNPGGGLVYNDPCGPVGHPNRQCNLVGKVISAGDHDMAEKPGGVFGGSFEDRHSFFGSPTINLMSTGDGAYNDQGIDREIADVGTDYFGFADFNFSGVRGGLNGNFYQWGFQAYPAQMPNGQKCWGEIRTPNFIESFGIPGCGQVLSPGAKTGSNQNLIANVNTPSGIPDSIRVYIQHLNRCFALPLGPSDCSPASGPNAGIYYDNLSFAFIDGAAPASLSIVPWMLFHDAFPVSTTIAPDTPPFDTTAAQVRSAFNIAQGTGNLLRHYVPGDSVIVGAPGAGKRVDFLFRILPGVGNYVTVGNRASGIRKRPDQAGAAAPNDGSFWGAYLGNNGAAGTSGGHAGGVWSQHVWNSARMDTAEINLFPAESNNGNLSGLNSGQWVSTYHELDPKFAILGVAKNRCFLQNTAMSQPATDININCGAGVSPTPGAPGNGAAWPPPGYATGGVPVAGSGLTASENGLALGKTYEHTKIIPDGQLTPGAHVEYFYRKSDDVNLLANVELAPDTMKILQDVELGSDGHRWQQFGVLPDRWKDSAFGTGGTGMACLLYYDVSDRRGDETAWVSIADSVGLTAPNKYGAHNGWHARGDQDIALGVNPASMPPGDPTIAVRAHIGQPGTLWDMWQQKAGESGNATGTIANRSASQASPGNAAGKFATSGPTGTQLRTYYRTIVMTTGDLTNTGWFGPWPDKTDDDPALLNNFANDPSPMGTTPRGVWANGRGFTEGMYGPIIANPGFVNTYFGTALRAGFFRASVGGANEIDLTPVAPWSTSGSIYGVNNFCTISNDLLNAISPATAAARYENVPSALTGPYTASVYAPETGMRVHRTLLDGFRMLSVGSRYTLTTGGLHQYVFETLVGLFGPLACAPSGAPIGVGDMPTGPAVVNFLNLRSANPMRSGEAKIAFGITKTEKVEIKVYDVTGRLVKTLANRVFQGPKVHDVTWDGTDDAGHSVARGVYFYQLRSPSFTSQKKLAVLSN
jgi:flagellar hook capping protein FlgD